MIHPQDMPGIIDDLYDGLYITDRERNIRYWNRSAERITGYRAEDIVGRNCADGILCHTDAAGALLCRDRCPLAATVLDGEPHAAEVYLRHKDGHRMPVSVRVTPLHDDQGRISGAVELFTDISFQDAFRLRVAELEKLALLDELTQLPNRRQLDSILVSHMARRARNQQPFGALFFDIDRFKQLNDAHGHAVGDEVLRAVARTTIACIRPYDVVGRWGGEEFVGVISGGDLSVLRVTAERLRALIGQSSVRTNTGPVSATVSIGGTMARADDTVETLIARADAFMYSCKQAGRNRVCVGE